MAPTITMNQFMPHAPSWRSAGAVRSWSAPRAGRRPGSGRGRRGRCQRGRVPWRSQPAHRCRRRARPAVAPAVCRRQGHERADQHTAGHVDGELRPGEGPYQVRGVAGRGAESAAGRDRAHDRPLILLAIPPRRAAPILAGALGVRDGGGLPHRPGPRGTQARTPPTRSIASRDRWRHRVRRFGYGGSGTAGPPCDGPWGVASPEYRRAGGPGQCGRRSGRPQGRVRIVSI